MDSVKIMLIPLLLGGFLPSARSQTTACFSSSQPVPGYFTACNSLSSAYTACNSLTASALNSCICNQDLFNAIYGYVVVTMASRTILLQYYRLTTKLWHTVAKTNGMHASIPMTWTTVLHTYFKTGTPNATASTISIPRRR